MHTITHRDRIQHEYSVECGHCGAEKKETPHNRLMGDDVMPRVPCRDLECTVVMCEECAGHCDGCGQTHCAEHLMDVCGEMLCRVCRRDMMANGEELAGGAK